MYEGRERRRIDWRQVIIAVCTAIIAALGGSSMTLGLVGCPGVIPPAPPPPPQADPPAPPPPSDPVEAVGKVIRPGVMCSGTVVGPRRDDGRWWIVTAAHCFERGGGVGTRCTYITRGGTSIPSSVVAVNAQSDVAILVTDERFERLAYVRVASATPPKGTSVYHVGFGQDRPGNKEEGQVIGVMPTRRMVSYRLSASPGDSGGGILLTGGGELLSPVCCTTCLGCLGDVAGGQPEVIREMLARPTEYVDVPPAVMPEFPKE